MRNGKVVSSWASGICQRFELVFTTHGDIFQTATEWFQMSIVGTWRWTYFLGSSIGRSLFFDGSELVVMSNSRIRSISIICSWTRISIWLELVLSAHRWSERRSPKRLQMTIIRSRIWCSLFWPSIRMGGFSHDGRSIPVADYGFVSKASVRLVLTWCGVLIGLEYVWGSKSHFITGMTKRLEITVVLARIGLRFFWSPIWRSVLPDNRRSRIWESVHNRCVRIVLTGPWILIRFKLVFTAKCHAVFQISKRGAAIICSRLWLVIIHEFAGEGFLIVFAFDQSFI